MSYETPACPACGADLSHSDDGDFNPWVCPRGHGMAVTLSEGYVRVDRDELQELWRRARGDGAEPSSRTCPMCGGSMVVAHAPAKAAGHEEPAVDVCITDELLWLDNGELAELPGASEKPAPSAEEQAHLDQIMEAYGKGLDGAFLQRERDGLLDRMADRATGYSHLLGEPTAVEREIEHAD